MSQFLLPAAAGVIGATSIWVARIRNTRHDPITQRCLWGGIALLTIALVLLLRSIPS